MKLPTRLYKRLEALERPGGDAGINAILRKYRGMKALRLATEKAREGGGERTRAESDQTASLPIGPSGPLGMGKPPLIHSVRSPL